QDQGQDAEHEACDGFAIAGARSLVKLGPRSRRKGLELARVRRAEPIRVERLLRGRRRRGPRSLRGPGWWCRCRPVGLRGRRPRRPRLLVAAHRRLLKAGSARRFVLTRARVLVVGRRTWIRSPVGPGLLRGAPRIIRAPGS